MFDDNGVRGMGREGPSLATGEKAGGGGTWNPLGFCGAMGDAGAGSLPGAVEPLVNSISADPAFPARSSTVARTT